MLADLVYPGLASNECIPICDIEGNYNALGLTVVTLSK